MWKEVASLPHPCWCNSPWTQSLLIGSMHIPPLVVPLPLVLVGVWVGHRCSKVGFKQVVSPKQNLCLLVESLYLSWVNACCWSALPTGNPERLHSAVPLDSKRYQVHLNQEQINKCWCHAYNSEFIVVYNLLLTWKGIIPHLCDGIALYICAWRPSRELLPREHLYLFSCTPFMVTIFVAT